MTFKYAGSLPDLGRSDPRRHDISLIIIHHAATVGTAAVLNALTGSREVSANAVGTDAGIYRQVAEDRRAWTSGAAGDGGKGADFDHKALTIEIANDTAAPTWTASTKTLEHVAQWIAAMSEKYSIPLDRNHVIGHRELYERYRASYATACPGGISVDDLVNRATQIKQQLRKEQDDEMKLATLRVAGTAATWAVSKATGRRWHIPSPEYYTLMLNFGLIEKVRDVPQNVFDFMINIWQTLGTADSTVEVKVDKLLQNAEATLAELKNAQ